jgi:hypothetical protein
MSAQVQGNVTNNTPARVAAALRSRRWATKGASLFLSTSLMVLAYAVCVPAIATADVDMTGRLEKVPTPKVAPGHVKPFATAIAGDYRCADAYSVIASRPFYFAIGNCPAGWTIEAVAYSSENSVTHEHSYGGYIGGAYSYCGWIDTRFPVEKLNNNSNTACKNGANNATELEDSTFLEKYDTNNAAHDGTYVVNPTPCPEYANYRPWSTNNVEKELIRTAPAYAANLPGSRTPALKWRYTTKYSSTDGTGQYVMVRDARVDGTEGNWVFVPRSCLSSPLPANEGEAINPPPPTATTGGFNTVTETSANLTGSVNPNGLDTHYYIEWGKEASKPYEAFAPTPYPGEDLGSGTQTLNRSVTATGLSPNTVYYYRAVAMSGTGTSEGGTGSFKTQALPPSVTTSEASEIQETSAQLNGQVNPNGADTHYYFEYGPTTSYGTRIPAGEGMDLGNGTSAIHTWNVISGLEPATTYHYRLVATSSGGTSEGLDATVKTPGGSSPFVTHDPTTHQEWVNYRGTDGGMWQLYFEPATGKWLGPNEYVGTAGKVAPGTSPFVTHDPTTHQEWVNYRGTDGGMWQLYFEPATGKWLGPSEFTGTAGKVAPGTSPFVTHDPTTHQEWVNYQGTDGGMWQLYWDGKSGKWSGPNEYAGTSGKVAPGTSPFVTYDPTTHQEWVNYRGTDGGMWQLYFEPATGWLGPNEYAGT